MNIIMRVINLQRLKQKLENISRIATRREVVRKAAREAARPLLKATQQATPVRTGLLKSSVKLRAAKKSRVRIGVNIIIRKIDWGKALAKGLVKGKYGAGGRKPPKAYRLFYGAFVEMGTKYMSARKFMKRTAQTHKKAVQADFIHRIFELIRQLGS